jgi:heme/copper-type cytochrome/quinol oxidase subunit 3
MYVKTNMSRQTMPENVTVVVNEEREPDEEEKKPEKNSNLLMYWFIGLGVVALLILFAWEWYKRSWEKQEARHDAQRRAGVPLTY